jgi:hypothetical protein
MYPLAVCGARRAVPRPVLRGYSDGSSGADFVGFSEPTNVAAIPVTPITPQVGHVPQHGVTSIHRFRNGRNRRIAWRIPMRGSYLQRQLRGRRR